MVTDPGLVNWRLQGGAEVTSSNVASAKSRGSSNYMLEQVPSEKEQWSDEQQRCSDKERESLPVTGPVRATSPVYKQQQRGPAAPDAHRAEV